MPPSAMNASFSFLFDFEISRNTKFSFVGEFGVGPNQLKMPEGRKNVLSASRLLFIWLGMSRETVRRVSVGDGQSNLVQPKKASSLSRQKRKLYYGKACDILYFPHQNMRSFYFFLITFAKQIVQLLASIVHR